MAYEIPGEVAALRVAVGHVLDRRPATGRSLECLRDRARGRDRNEGKQQRETRERGLQRQGRPAAKAAPGRHAHRSSEVAAVGPSFGRERDRERGR